jgi:hypothetical protein
MQDSMTACSPCKIPQLGLPSGFPTLPDLPTPSLPTLSLPRLRFARQLKNGTVGPSSPSPTGPPSLAGDGSSQGFPPTGGIDTS